MRTKAEEEDDDAPNDDSTPLAAAYEVMEERVNLVAIKEWMGMIGSRTYTLHDKSCTMFEMLHVVRLRAIDNLDGTGTLKVIVREGVHPEGLMGRRYSGVWHA